METRIGSVTLPNPVMTASGTSGHGSELAAFADLNDLGAVVVKSLCATRFNGNDAPRLYPLPVGMLNSVGLQGPGLKAWIEHDLPAAARNAERIVVSIWGRTVEDYAKAAAILKGSPAVKRSVIAVEVNVSCPNIEDRSRMFAHSVTATSEAVAAAECGLPRWAKLSPNTHEICEVAAAALQAGAEALTLVNTAMGVAVDVERRSAVLGAVGGGLSGPALKPIAMRAVWECRDAFPDASIIGVGGVASGVDALEMIMAGANAVQVGTATFRDPRAPWKVISEIRSWCKKNGETRLEDLVGVAHA